MKAPFFIVIGISYKDADTSTRGKFSLSSSSSERLIKHSIEIGLSNLVVNSTCNRVEIYSSCKDPNLLIDLLCKYSHGTVKDFKNYGYVPLKEKKLSNTFLMLELA